MRRNGECRLGAVLYAFKPSLVDSVKGSVNDGEEVGLEITLSGSKTVFAGGDLVYFDASVSLGHVLQRWRRMYFGYMLCHSCPTLSMDSRTAGAALMKSIVQRPSRFIWSIPASALDSYSRCWLFVTSEHLGRGPNTCVG